MCDVCRKNQICFWVWGVVVFEAAFSSIGLWTTISFLLFPFVFDQEPHEFSFIQSEHCKHFFFKDQPPASWLFKCFHSQLYTKMSRFVWHVSELLTTEERQKRSPQQEQTDQKVTGSERRLGEVIAKRSNVPTWRVTSHVNNPAKTSYLSNKNNQNWATRPLWSEPNLSHTRIKNLFFYWMFIIVGWTYFLTRK